jgi:hypothetical protein
MKSPGSTPSYSRKGEQTDLLDGLAHPPAAYRLWPLFVFNEEHEGPMGEPRISDLLGKLAESGFGGVYIHPRPGMLTEYLSPRWFELVRHTIRECRRLGLVPALYDENSYPSGFAGGAVPAIAPDTRSRYLLPIKGVGMDALPSDALAIYRWTDNDRPGSLIAKTAVADDTPWMAFVLRDMSGEPFLGEGPYVSLLDPLTTEVFLEQTHQRYKEELSAEDWQALGAIFTDEPHLPGSSLGNWSPGLHCNHRVIAAFTQRYSYRLIDHLLDLYHDTATAAATRFDFYELLHQMWLENWANKLGHWCTANRIRLTGHYLEHDWPSPYATPGQMHLLSRMDWPGTDFLECFALLGHGFYDLQGFASAIKGEEPHALYTLRQADSVAAQYGKERIMNECWGAGGHDSAPADWLRLGRYLAAHGVDHLVPHHCFQTLSGTRKMDHPQFVSDQSAFFDHLRPLNDELARLSLINAIGSTENRILLLDVLTSGYVLSRKADALNRDGRFAPDEEPFASPLRSILPLRSSVQRLAQDMSNRLLDFDIGDEYILEEIGSVKEGKLVVGHRRYDCLVLPRDCVNLRSATVTLLNAWLAAGGTILAHDMESLLVNGRPAPQPLRHWKASHPEQFLYFKTEEDLLDALIEGIPPFLRFDRPPPPGLSCRRLLMPDGWTAALLVNAHPEIAFEGIPHFAVAPEQVLLYRPESDTLTRLDAHHRLHLGPTAAAVLFLDPSPSLLHAAMPAAIQSASPPPPRCHLSDVQRLDRNVLVIDHCILETDTTSTGPVSVHRANKQLWSAQGISGNGWFMRVQHRANLMRRASHLLHPHGARVRYHATIEEKTFLDGIDLVVERPELWTVTVNGHQVDFTASSAWRDPRLRQINIGPHLVVGHNEICLASTTFDLRQEISPLYLLGDFSVNAAHPGFVIGPARPLDLGDWVAQGLPFYDGTVEYSFSLQSSEPALLEIQADAWCGAVLILHHGPRTEICYGPSVRLTLNPADGPAFSLRLIGLPKNLFGPWHEPLKPRRRALPSYWKHEQEPLWTPPPGAAYDLLPLGLHWP